MTASPADPGRTKVLWLINGLARGGAEHLLLWTAQHLDHDRYECAVVRLRQQDDTLVPELHRTGARTAHLGVTGITDGRWVPRLRRIIEVFQPDLIHAHSPVIGAMGRLVGPSAVPFVQHENSPWPQHPPAVRLLERLTYGRVDRSLALSDAIAASVRLPSQRPAAVTVIPPGIPLGARAQATDRAARAAARHLLELPEEAFVVMNVANLTAKKDHATLVRAFAVVAARVADARLVIVGFGSQERPLRALASQLRVGDRVHLVGGRIDVPDLLPAADVFVMPSQSEGFGLAAIEAMAAAVPCVSSDVDGLGPIVGRAGGTVVPAGDVQGFAAAIVGVHDDAGLRAAMIDGGRRVAQAHPVGAYCDGVQAVYDDLLAASSGRRIRR